jgi:hypothetical protein
VSPANQAADIKIAYAFTGTASATRRVFGSDTQIGGPSQYFNSSSATHVNTNSERTLMKLGNQAATPGLTTAVAYGLNDTYSIGIQEEMIVTVTVAGDLSLQWAQNAATAGITTTVNAGSYITSRRIA